MLADESFVLHKKMTLICMTKSSKLVNIQVFNLISYLKQANVILCCKQLVQTLPSHCYHLVSALRQVKIQRLVPRSLYVHLYQKLFIHFMLFGKRSLPLPRFSLVVRLCKFQITITWITTRGSSIMNKPSGLASKLRALLN